MFQWLQDQIDEVNTRKFFLVDGPASKQLRDAVKRSDFPLPPSYRQFVLEYGNAKLYRQSSYWLVEVYAGPREAESDKGEALIQFGRTHTSLAYFKESHLIAGEESPVFEWRHGQGIRQTADGFSEWLESKCAAARKKYKKKEWQAIQQGPPPFSERELEIVEARRLYRWKVVGVAKNEDLQFEITNGSKIVLPYLSVDIRGKLRPPNEGPLEGGAYLPVESIRPGETAIVEFDCYKQFIAPEDTEVLECPDPGPEDRELYWEFKLLDE